MMKAIILADRTHRSLKGWRPWQQIPLLRVGEISLIEHCVYSLANAGVTELEIALGPDALAVERQLGCGARWGVNITYFAGLGDENPSELLPRMGSITEPTLVVRGDVYRDDVVAEFVAQASRCSQSNLCATNRSGPLLLANISSLDHADAFLTLGSPRQELGDQVAQFSQAQLIELTSSDEFVAANGRALHWGTMSGRLRGMNTRRGLLTDVDALVHRTAQSKGLAYVGRQSRVCADSRFENTVVLGEGVVVGRGSRLSNVIVLDGALVPGNANLSNTIVAEAPASRSLADLNACYRDVGGSGASNRRRARRLLADL